MLQIRCVDFTYEIYPMGDCAVVIHPEKAADPDRFLAVQFVADCLANQPPFPGQVEFVRAYDAVTVYYEPLQVMYGRRDLVLKQGSSSEEFSESPYVRVCSFLEKTLVDCRKSNKPNIALNKTIEIPVCYGEAFGPDLQDVAERNHLTMDEVVELHSGGHYLVHMIGFSPGFPYLGGMSKRIASPRKASPRQRVPAGTVGIAGIQTGIYSIPTPGGWQLIGRTPLPLFLPFQDPPCLLQAGDTVKFRRITSKEYSVLEEKFKWA